MPVLSPQQRTMLEKAVKEARKASEIGAFNALQASAVNHAEPYAHMTPEQRTLRNALRSKARLLGDELEPNGIQQISNLAYELAYETWHKMLFATFLEANDLLMHHSGIAVTFADCEELAKEENYTDKWDAAAAYASKMLPAIFRIDDPLMQVKLATNDKIKLEVIIDGLEKDIFTADDALGWVYQFWQSEAKATINATGEKIDGAKLPAVTQLFTEPYMVHFLIDNTLGAWWVKRNPGVTPPVKFEYLRTLDDGSPAAGNFEGWPDKTAKVTSLDPCMGSGHFVASLFPVFAALRMHEEGLTKEEATDKVITENLHGLELDARCTQIAAFNLALTAWKFCEHYKELPEMNLACSGIAPKGKKEDWIKLVANEKNHETKQKLENGMSMLYDHFQLAPELGSLLDPTTIKADAFTASFEELLPVLNQALGNELGFDEQKERGVIAAGIAKAGQLLAKQYMVLITNVPYLKRHKQSSKLCDFADKYYKDAKGDLATIFISRMQKNLYKFGSISIVSPHNWLFLGAYKSFRNTILRKSTLNLICPLGSGAFETINGEVVNVDLQIIQNKKPSESQNIFAIDASTKSSILMKINSLILDSIKNVKQSAQLTNPDQRIFFTESEDQILLSKLAVGLAGYAAGDSVRFERLLCEIPIIDINWEYLQGTTSDTQFFGGKSSIIFWQKEEGEIYKLAESVKNINHIAQNWLRGKPSWGKKGIVISQMGKLAGTLYTGDIYNCNCCAIILNDILNMEAIWCYVESGLMQKEIRKIDQSIKVTPQTLLKIPIDVEYWQKIADEKYPNGLPKPYSDDPTQWLFHGHPIKTDNPLHVATARLLGYRWPAESDEDMELADEAKTLIDEAKSFNSFTDEDGIFCIPSVNAEQAGADRLRTFLQAVFGEDYNNKTINELLEKEGAKASNLEDWFRNEFFIQHCKVFGNRPFIWHIWDGRKDGFSALVNYHKLDKENLSKLIYTYLGDWIRMCDAKRKAGDSGADGLWDAANKLQEKLILILNGEAPYDIFVRWKPLSEQTIGWEPDLNDGVRLNIRPFVEAGVLRSKFNIKWGIDRGKNPLNSHWGEIRDNDIHLSLEEKRVSRE
ncbi:MAG: N-6 DNA methylase [Arcicella sp.]|nr:N-6 DNA methylase [Arcicella sp.]